MAGIIGSRVNRGVLFILLTCFSAIVAGYLQGSGTKAPFYLCVVVLTLMPLVGMASLGRNIRLQPLVVKSLFVAACYIAVALVTTRYFSMAYPEFLFIFLVFGFSLMAKVPLGRLLAVTNATFLSYLALSLLLYVDVIKLERELAFFEYGDFLFFGSPFRTFIGFYGSTAAIDAYGIFFAIINLVYNRSKVWRWVFVVIGILSSAATLRYTPLVSLALALVATAGWKAVPKRGMRSVYVFLTVLLTFSTAVIVAAIIDSVGPEAMDALTLATSGRAPIWVEMLKLFFADGNSWRAVVFGSGSDAAYSVDFGFSHGALVANPHNNYLSFLLKYGVAGWMVLLGFFSIVLSRIKVSSDYFIAIFVLLSGVTNLHTFGFNFPIYVFWFGAFYRAGIVEGLERKRLLGRWRQEAVAWR